MPRSQVSLSDPVSLGTYTNLSLILDGQIEPRSDRSTRTQPSPSLILSRYCTVASSRSYQADGMTATRAIRTKRFFFGYVVFLLSVERVISRLSV